MMNRINTLNRKKVIIGAVIGVLIVFMLAVVFLAPQEKPPLPSGNQISPGAGGVVQDNVTIPYRQFLTSGGSQICTFAVNTENQNIGGVEIPSKVDTGTIYAANGKIKAQFTLTTKDGTIQQHMLVDAYTAYLWNNLNNGGVKFLVGEKSPEELVKQPLVLQCRDWTPNNSVFDIPANIVFTEITDFNPDTP